MEHSYFFLLHWMKTFETLDGHASEFVSEVQTLWRTESVDTIRISHLSLEAHVRLTHYRAFYEYLIQYQCCVYFTTFI
jgi:hypothetical protein